nr:ORF37 [Bracoviriform inaniti]
MRLKTDRIKFILKPKTFHLYYVIRYSLYSSFNTRFNNVLVQSILFPDSKQPHLHKLKRLVSFFVTNRKLNSVKSSNENVLCPASEKLKFIIRLNSESPVSKDHVPTNLGRQVDYLDCVRVNLNTMNYGFNSNNRDLNADIAIKQDKAVNCQLVLIQENGIKIVYLDLRLSLPINELTKKGLGAPLFTHKAKLLFDRQKLSLIIDNNYVTKTTPGVPQCILKSNGTGNQTNCYDYKFIKNIFLTFMYYGKAII